MFRVAVLRVRRTKQDVACELGVSHNHLVLVLAGKRKASAQVEAGIAAIQDPSGER